MMIPNYDPIKAEIQKTTLEKILSKKLSQIVHSPDREVNNTLRSITKGLV